MINNMTVTLEWATQVSTAAIKTKERVTGDRSQQRADSRRFLRRRQRVKQDVERREHQPDPDRDTAEIARAGLATSLECNNADQEQ
jgi:hypothetical protein